MTHRQFASRVALGPAAACMLFTASTVCAQHPEHGDVPGHAGMHDADHPAADSQDHLMQEQRTMTLQLAGAADAAFPLFGPVREAEWSKDWKPDFIAPLPPAQGPGGAVFTTGGKGGTHVWVMTRYDTTERRVAYVVVVPDFVTLEIAIAVTPQGPAQSTAEVSYRYTALQPDGNEFIQKWLAQWPHMAPHWEHAINGALAGGSPSGG